MKASERQTLKFEITFYEKILSENPKHADVLIALAEAYTLDRQYQKGLELDKRLARLFPKDPTVRYNLACSYALTENEGKAISHLEKAIALGYSDFEHLKRDSDLKILHQNPRFVALMQGDLKGS